MEEIFNFKNAPKKPEELLLRLRRKRACLIILIAVIAAGIVTLDCFAVIPKTVTVYTDDSKEIKSSSYKTCAMTAGQFFEANNIEYDRYDEVSCEEDDRITDNMTVKITLVVDIRITSDDKTVICHTSGRTVGDVIRDSKINLGKNDITIPKLSETVSEGDEIVIKRVKIATEKSKEKLSYDTLSKPGYAVPIGRTRTVQKGRSGIRETTFKVTYVDGKEYSREKIKTETTRTPKDKIVEYGLAIDMSVPENLNYSRVYRGCRAVSYNYSETRYTASGRKCEYGIAAVDTNIFPFGTKLYITGYGYAVAADRGAAISGTTVDLYFDHRIQCMTWGAQSVDIYVLK